MCIESSSSAENGRKEQRTLLITTDIMTPRVHETSAGGVYTQLSIHEHIEMYIICLSVCLPVRPLHVRLPVCMHACMCTAKHKHLHVHKSRAQIVNIHTCIHDMYLYRYVAEGGNCRCAPQRQGAPPRASNLGRLIPPDHDKPEAQRGHCRTSRVGFRGPPALKSGCIWV